MDRNFRTTYEMPPQFFVAFVAFALNTNLVLNKWTNLCYVISLFITFCTSVGQRKGRRKRKLVVPKTAAGCNQQLKILT